MCPLINITEWDTKLRVEDIYSLTLAEIGSNYLLNELRLFFKLI